MMKKEDTQMVQGGEKGYLKINKKREGTKKKTQEKSK
jgi:hypothetical protein